MERIETEDPLRFETWINPLVPGTIIRARNDRFFVSAERARFPRAGIFELRFGGYTVRNPGRHAYTTVTLMLEGETTFVTVEGERICRAGSIHVENYGSPFTITSGDRPHHSLVLVFDERFVDEELRNHGEATPDEDLFLPALMDLESPKGRDFREAAFFAWERMKRADPSSTSERTVAAMERFLLSSLLDLAGNPTDGPMVRLGSPLPGYVRRAVRFIDDRFAEHLDLETIAGAAGVSTRSLSREFRRRFGTTVTAYIKDRRMKRAREYLTMPHSADGTVAETAYRCGFRHAGRFTSAYRMAYGESPTETLRKSRFSSGSGLPERNS